MRSGWSLLFLLSLLSLLPVGGLAGKRRKLRSRQCNSKQSALQSTNSTTNTTTTNAAAAQTYTLQDSYEGQSFLGDDWQFFTTSDPTNGLVTYQSREEAIQKKLAIVQDGVTILSVDNTTSLSAGENRDSVRIFSSKTYNNGLFIADFEAMPTGCAVWPAYWTVGPNWPTGGEIDIVEGVNTQDKNQMTLHSGPGCSMPKTAQSLGTGTLISTSCTSTSNSNGGCAFTDSSTASFGKGFNDLQGGVFATRWDKRGISTWRFDRSSIPRDITAKKPNPSGWGTPVAAFPSTDCDMGSHFFDQSLVIDTTLCGDWAGTASVYGASGCPGTCAEAVADPTNFKNAQWKINYISVYGSG